MSEKEFKVLHFRVINDHIEDSNEQMNEIRKSKTSTRKSPK